VNFLLPLHSPEFSALIAWLATRNGQKQASFRSGARLALFPLQNAWEMQKHKKSAFAVGIEPVTST
jgi:hypothetical protein